MDDHAYVGELLAGIVYMIVGVRLLRLAQRTGEAPERLLAVSFMFMAASSGFYVLPVFSVFAPLWMPLNFAGRVTFVAHVVVLALFTRCVFRSDDRWGTWLVWGTAAFTVTGVGGSALAGDWEGFSINSGWFQLEWIGFTVPFAWTAADTFAQFLQARRRLRLGLCDLLVCNRYLLWAMFALFQVGMCLVLLPQYADYEATGQFMAKWDAIYGALGIAALVMIWFVFFPPAFYRRWINGAAPADEAVRADA